MGLFRPSPTWDADSFDIPLDRDVMAWIDLRRSQEGWGIQLILLLLAPVAAFVLLVVTVETGMNIDLWLAGALAILFSQIRRGLIRMRVAAGPRQAGVLWRMPWGTKGFMEPITNFRGVGWRLASLGGRSPTYLSIIELRHRRKGLVVPLAVTDMSPYSWTSDPLGLPMIPDPPRDKVRGIARHLGLPVLVEFDGLSRAVAPDEDLAPLIRQPAADAQPIGPTPADAKIEWGADGTRITLKRNRPVTFVGALIGIVLLAMVLDSDPFFLLVALGMGFPLFAIALGATFLTTRHFEITANSVAYWETYPLAGAFERWRVPLDQVLWVSFHRGWLRFRRTDWLHDQVWVGFDRTRREWLPAFLTETIRRAAPEAGQ